MVGDGRTVTRPPTVTETVTRKLLIFHDGDGVTVVTVVFVLFGTVLTRRLSGHPATVWTIWHDREPA